MGIQDRDYWREWFNEREDSGVRRRPPELPGTRWHWSLKALAWLLIATVVFGLIKRLEKQRLAARPPAPVPHATPAPQRPAPPPAAHAVSPPPAYAPPVAPAPQPVYLAPVPAPAPSRVTLYLCKDYSGGMFWSSGHCSQHRALIERMESVPASLPFDQQVNLARQARDQAEALTRPPPVVEHHTVIVDHADGNPSCAALSQRIAHLDSMARQPQSASTQDWITAQKAEARSRQFRLRC